MLSERPVQGNQASLRCVRKPDLDNAVVAHRCRIRRVRPQQDFVAIDIPRNIHVTSGASHLADEVHVRVEHLDAVIAAGSGSKPRDGDVIVGRDIEAVESPALRIEDGTLAVGADLVNKYRLAVTYENEMVAVHGNIGLSHSANDTVFRKRVNESGGLVRNV